MNDEELYLDQSLINDFFAGYEDAQNDINNAIAQLLIAYETALIDRIFRLVHSVKSNLSMIGEKQSSDIMHSLEDILSGLRNNRFEDIQPVLHLLQVVIEEVRIQNRNKLYDGKATTPLDSLQSDMEVLASLPEADLVKNLKGFLTTIELQGDYDVAFLNALYDEPVSAVSLSADDSNEAVDRAIESMVSGNTDLSFFRELIEQLENFLPFWRGRSKKILQMLMAMNRIRGGRVDEQQLIAAVYMHDIGMGFIAPFITHKPYCLEADEELIMRDHIHHGSELLKRIPAWQAAADMVAAHHERIDGSGYPLGLKADQICDGAKLLAIGDAYWAMTNDRMYVYKKKPVVNALMDINKKSGVLYDEQWVNAFNQVLNKT